MRSQVVYAPSRTNARDPASQYFLLKIFLRLSNPTPSRSDISKRRPPAVILNHCGGGGIRTHGPISETAVFKTAPFDHSGTPPSVALALAVATFGLPLPSNDYYAHMRLPVVPYFRFFCDSFGVQ